MNQIPKTKGFALTICLIMIVLAAILVVALLTNASSDRISADSLSKRLRAEMAAQSALSAALARLVGSNSPADFRFVTTAGDDAKPSLIPLAAPDPNSGSVSPTLSAKRLLYSEASTPATITLSTTATPKITRPAGYFSVTAPDNSGNSQETERYAFYIDEGGGRQNLAIQGSSSRTYAIDPSELPLVTATAAPTPFTTQQLTDLKSQRSLIFTPATANPILSSNPVTPLIDDYSYATASAVVNLAPDGKPRVNLQKLKEYIDGLPVDQTANNPRSQLVSQLLNPSETGDNWGGGNLSILTKLPAYSGNQPKQIVANLIDYLDDDLFPTTDNVDNPTYFGVEGRAAADGTVVGHPYINFVGTGLVFNRSNAAASKGGLNSTRVLVVLGVINPWTKPTKDWDTFYVKPEFEIKVAGDATGGNLGNKAQNYFHSDFNTSDSSNQLTTYPSKTIAANSGYSFPSPDSSITNYANFFDILNTSGRQPPGMVFSNLGFQITKVRLKFTDTDGRSGYVQVLDSLQTIPQPANPATVDLDHSGSPSSLTYKFATGAPDKMDFHLNSDPRLSFLSSSWILSKSTENSSNPPNPTTTLNLFSGSNQSNWDFVASAPTATNHLWYTKTDVTADFYVKSPPRKDTSGNFPDPRFVSAGELGFIHTGIPWETLRFYVTGGEANGKDRDRELLAYAHSGTFTPVDYGAVPTHIGATAPTKPIPLLGGPLNVNTNKLSTLQSLFLGASALADSDATARANGGSSDPDVLSLAQAVKANANNKILALPGDYLGIPAVQTITNGSGNDTDFKRETLARRTANVLGTHSTRFTVYALGEARDKAGATDVTTSHVNLRAEVELQTDQNGRPVPRVLSSAYYLD